MPEHEASWAVVATVDEPPALVQAFVAWHLSLGASEVILCFDRADDPAADLLSDVPKVTVVRCDAAHWARLGKRRPDKHQIRQVRNATDVYRRVTSDWLLHCDADEFLSPARPVAECLAQVYPWIDCAVVPVMERVFVAGGAAADVFGGMFRRPFSGKSEAARDILGAGYDLTQRGLTGHAIGKAFTRVGRDLEVSIHRARADDADVRTETLQGLNLLQFDGLTRLHWVYKLLRKADAFAHHGGMVPSPHRQRQIDAVLADPAAAFELHDRLKVVASEELAQQNVLADVAFDPAAMIGAKVDLSSEAFDAWLRKEKAQVFAAFDLRV
jgi:hypothetical protein